MTAGQRATGQRATGQREERRAALAGGELHRAIEEVVARDACSGCGLCTRLDPAIRMRLDERGHLRPVATGPSRAREDAVAVLRASCPGIVVRAPEPPPGAERHPLLGAHVGLWRAHAADPEVRRAGSSGGVLTAIHSWLLASGRAVRVTGAAMDDDSPRRSVPVTIMSREQALRAAGSRYAPVAALDNAEALLPGSAVTGKPCEIAALRSAAPSLVDGEPPLMLSFFCAGTPSQVATGQLLAELGIDDGIPLERLRYRGDGWPGSFTAVGGGRTATADYERSWGRTLGPAVQWRCKVCVDGTGESADIVAADAWLTDERGYPVFSESEGSSALLARTARGREAILAAAAAGAIRLEPLGIAELAAAQPLQTGRRRFLAARLLGARLAGRKPPRYPGFPLLAPALRSPRTALRVLRGAYRRARDTSGSR